MIIDKERKTVTVSDCTDYWIVKRLSTIDRTAYYVFLLSL